MGWEKGVGEVLRKVGCIRLYLLVSLVLQQLKWKPRLNFLMS
jgi:hypothetical protein